MFSAFPFRSPFFDHFVVVLKFWPRAQALRYVIFPSLSPRAPDCPDQAYPKFVSRFISFLPSLTSFFLLLPSASATGSPRLWVFCLLGPLTQSPPSFIPRFFHLILSPCGLTRLPLASCFLSLRFFFFFVSLICFRCFFCSCRVFSLTAGILGCIGF